MIAIKVEDIQKVYRSGASDPVHAVDGVSFEVSQGKSTVCSAPMALVAAG